MISEDEADRCGFSIRNKQAPIKQGCMKWESWNYGFLTVYSIIWESELQKVLFCVQWLIFNLKNSNQARGRVSSCFFLILILERSDLIFMERQHSNKKEKLLSKSS